MFSKKPKKHIHNFDVVWHKGDVEYLIQQLHCKICDKHFIGYGGTLKNPTFVHEMKHQFNVNSLQAPNVIERIGTFDEKNE